MALRLAITILTIIGASESIGCGEEVEAKLDLGNYSDGRVAMHVKVPISLDETYFHIASFEQGSLSVPMNKGLKGAKYYEYVVSGFEEDLRKSQIILVFTFVEPASEATTERKRTCLKRQVLTLEGGASESRVIYQAPNE